MRLHRALASFALATIGAASVSCGVEVEGGIDDHVASKQPPAYGDTLIEGSIADISGLIPNITTDSASHEVGAKIYDGLVQTDKNLKYVPQMAESWTFSPDCLTLTFKLRRDVRWHDGRPFTADDVMFTYQTMIHPKTPTAYKESFQLVKEALVLDPYTFRVTYSEPYAKALSSWGWSMLPRHLLEPYVLAGKLKEAPQNGTSPIGTGPYRFKEWKSGEKVVLVANPDYYAGRPYIGRVVYRIIPSQATIFLELKARGVDSTSLTAIQYARQTAYRAFQKAYTKYRYPGNAYTFLSFNLRDPRFADKRVRQAFAHAIDKQELIDGVLLGLAREATGPYRPGTWAYTDKVKRYEFSPEKAKALLAEAGWKDRDGDGIVEDKDGKPFAFTIRTNQGNEERKKVAEIIQQRLKEIGVKAEIQILEWASFIKEFVRKRRFEALVMGLGGSTDPDQYVVWHSSQMGPEQMNQASYSNPEADRLLELGRASCVQEDRVKHYHRLQEVLAEDQPMVFLYFRDALPVVSSRVRGIEPGPAGIGYNFIEWYVPLGFQRYTSS